MKLDAEHPQRVSEADGKSPFLTLLFFEHPTRASQVACWKVDFKSDQVDSWEYLSGKCITLVKSFTLVERVVPDTQFDGTLPTTGTGKAVFYHGFLLGVCVPDRERANGMVSIVYDPKSPKEGVEVDNLDQYFARHPLSPMIGDDHVVRR